MPRYSIEPQLEHLGVLGVRTRGVIHVGANSGQEVEEVYVRGGIRHALLIEPLAGPLRLLRETIKPHRHYHAIQALCADRDGEKIALHVASNDGGSSSILPPKEHLRLYPSVSFAAAVEMETTTLDRLRRDFLAGQPKFTPAHFDLLVIDVQGAGMRVLRGAAETLDTMKAVSCEVSHIELYEGGATFGEIIAFLEARGFKLFFAALNRKLWGDALFVHPDRMHRSAAVETP